MRTVIRGGTVVSADGAELADVLIEDEIVAAVAAPGSGVADAWPQGADRVVDATGRYVIPGGIDGHTPMDMPFGGLSPPTRSKPARGPPRGAARR
jgi:dihydropyrimidinase